METFSEDTQYILQQAGLEDKLSVEWKHRTGGKQRIMYLSQNRFNFFACRRHRRELGHDSGLLQPALKVGDRRTLQEISIGL